MKSVLCYWVLGLVFLGIEDMLLFDRFFVVLRFVNRNVFFKDLAIFVF